MKAKVHSDFGTPFRKQHGPLILERVSKGMEDTTQRDRVRALNTDDPLYRLRRQGSITARQKAAGELLREMWVLAGRDPQITSRYMEQIGRGSIQGVYTNGIDYHQRFIALMRKFTPAVQSALMVCVLQEELASHRVGYARQGLIRLQRVFGT